MADDDDTHADPDYALCVPGGTDLSATHDASNASIFAALNALGAEPSNVRLAASAAPPPLDCPHFFPATAPMQGGRDEGGGGGGSGRQADGGGGKGCSSYALPCGMHAVLGQLWSRRVAYEMVTAHEARQGFAFDSIMCVLRRTDWQRPVTHAGERTWAGAACGHAARVRRSCARLAVSHMLSPRRYMRPDMAALIPMLPWCFYSWHYSRNKVDHVWWLTRRDAANALREPYDDVYRCRLASWGRSAEYNAACERVADEAFRRAEMRPSSDGTGTTCRFGPEILMKARAAVHGAQLYDDPALAALNLVRPNRPSLPHAVDCKYGTARGVALQAGRGHSRAHYDLVYEIIDGYRKVSHTGHMNKRLEGHCKTLTYANPANVPLEGYS